MEYLITARKWDYLKGFLGVFGSCEEDFVNLIDGMYPTEKPVDVSSRDSMQLEAQNVFLAVDDLYQVREHSIQGGTFGAVDTEGHVLYTSILYLAKFSRPGSYYT